jgi:hypothetical protein
MTYVRDHLDDPRFEAPLKLSLFRLEARTLRIVSEYLEGILRTMDNLIYTLSDDHHLVINVVGNFQDLRSCHQSLIT